MLCCCDEQRSKDDPIRQVRSSESHMDLLWDEDRYVYAGNFSSISRRLHQIFSEVCHRFFIIILVSSSDSKKNITAEVEEDEEEVEDEDKENEEDAEEKDPDLKKEE